MLVCDTQAWIWIRTGNTESIYRRGFAQLRKRTDTKAVPSLVARFRICRCQSELTFSIIVAPYCASTKACARVVAFSRMLPQNKP